MPRYSIAINRAGVNAANTVLAELRAAANARSFVREIGVSMAALPSTAPRLVLARPTNAPAGGTAGNNPIGDDAADGAALTSFFTAGWTTVPTFAAAGPWKKVGGLPLTLGAGFIWTFPGAGLVVPLAGSLLIANLNASGATLGSFDMYLDWEE